MYLLRNLYPTLSPQRAFKAVYKYKIAFKKQKKKKSQGEKTAAINKDHWPKDTTSIQPKIYNIKKPLIQKVVLNKNIPGPTGRPLMKGQAVHVDRKGIPKMVPLLRSPYVLPLLPSQPGMVPQRGPSLITEEDALDYTEEDSLSNIHTGLYRPKPVP